jgi:hypothetical protein
MRRSGELACVIALTATLATPTVAAADELAVDIINASTPTLCAETDNVYLKFISGEAGSFTIEAAHPAYAGTIVVEHATPEFRNCDMSGDPVYRFTPRRITLYESEQWQLVGHAFETFWRPSEVPVRVGERVENGLHLIQLWHRFHERAEEVLVLYPADGYWRARPLPPAHLRWTAYGSSFLIGPVETGRRPFVDLKEVVFDPATRSFRLDLARGGSATLNLAELDQDRIVLGASLQAPVPAGQPFAALRSMYVTETDADVARIAWRGRNEKGWREAPVMSFEHANAVELWAGRMVPSRHNLSAPDMVFRGFAASR